MNYIYFSLLYVALLIIIKYTTCKELLDPTNTVTLIWQLVYTNHKNEPLSNIIYKADLFKNDKLIKTVYPTNKNIFVQVQIDNNTGETNQISSMKVTFEDLSLNHDDKIHAFVYATHKYPNYDWNNNSVVSRSKSDVISYVQPMAWKTYIDRRFLSNNKILDPVTGSNFHFGTLTENKKKCEINPECNTYVHWEIQGADLNRGWMFSDKPGDDFLTNDKYLGRKNFNTYVKV